MAAVFREMAIKHGPEIKSSPSDIKALETGIDLEAKSVDFYKKQLEKASDKMEIEFIKKLVNEERRHHFALSDMKLYLENPTVWFEEQERVRLDGA